MENHIKLIAQDFNIYEGDQLPKEARTGAISIHHLVAAGARGVILGHSEVGDSLAVVHHKLKTIIQSEEFEKYSDEFTMHILVGESWEEFEHHTHEQVAHTVAQKCRIIFQDIPASALRNLIIGYEPKWGSQGSGRDDMPPPAPVFISTCLQRIQEFMAATYPTITPRYVYGGRITPERALEILQDEHIDGLILGSACNTLQKTMDIIASMQQAKGSKDKVIICNFKAYLPPDPYERYVQELKKLPKDFLVYLAPAYTDIRLLQELI